MNTTAMSTTTVELMTSRRVGQATFLSSACDLARGTARGPTRSFGAWVPGCGRRPALGRARACRCPGAASCASSVGSRDASDGFDRAMSRAGGTRTPNRRFWRPVLCQLSYCPPARGAGQVRIAAAGLVGPLTRREPRGSAWRAWRGGGRGATSDRGGGCAGGGDGSADGRPRRRGAAR